MTEYLKMGGTLQKIFSILRPQIAVQILLLFLAITNELLQNLKNYFPTWRLFLNHSCVHFFLFSFLLKLLRKEKSTTSLFKVGKWWCYYERGLHEGYIIPRLRKTHLLWPLGKSGNMRTTNQTINFVKSRLHGFAEKFL